MPGEPFDQRHFDYIAGRIRWHKRLADRTMIQFIAVRLGLVLTSAALPALTLLPDRIWAIVAAVLVAVLTGLDTQFQWGEEWRHFRSTQVALQTARRDYEWREHAIARRGTAGDIGTSAENFSRFYNETKAIEQSETDRFFKFRITPPAAAGGSESTRS